MAYCVQCGVKLADGAPVCPLCNTAVILPPSVVEPKAQPLFAQPLKLGNGSGITKWRKGVFELAFALAVVSIVAVGLSLGLSGLGRYSFIPIFSIAWVTATLGICLYAKPTYVREATILLVATALYLVGLDLFDLALSWSLIAAPALLVLWVVAVAPWTGMKVRGVLALALVSVLLYLLLLNIVVAGALTWFVPVALPSVLVLVALVSLFSLFFLRRKTPIIPLVDVVMATLVTLFTSISCFDLFLTRYQRGVPALRWSMSLVWGALTALIVLLALTCSRRLRRYFTTTPR